MDRDSKGRFIMGHGFSENTIKKMAKSQSMKTGSKNNFYGKKHSKKTKEHWSSIRKGRPSSKGMLGKHHSEKTIKKMSEARRGEKCYLWKGGKAKHTQGYIMVKAHEHPYRNNMNYVFEHRLVMEKHLGRLLQPWEVVHHKNKDVTDNRIENLTLFSSAGEHMKEHIRLKKYKRVD